MKLVSYRRGTRDSFGVLADGAVFDGPRLLGGRHGSLREALEAGALGELSDALATAAADHALDDVELLPVVPDPGKILCAGVNYHAHRREASRATAGHPTIFTRYADSQVGHGRPLVRPPETEAFDYEGELAVVIGGPGRRIAAADAAAHIAGYACYNDATVRDWQRHAHQWTPGKTFPGTGAFGPALVTADEIPDPAALTLTTRVNGEVRQSAPVADLIFDIPSLIAYVSTFTPLRPGDVIVTGTPSGVGMFRDPPRFLLAGDTVEVEIPGVGRLSNTVVDELDP